MNKASAFTDRSIRLSLLACLVGFGGFVLWASFAKLDEGVSASGQVVVQDNRKQIQHLEGGMISAMHVREGQTVEKGDVLLELEPLQSETARDELAQDYAVQIASRIRLEALRSGAKTVDYSPIAEQVEIDQDVLDGIIARQSELFQEQRTAHAAEVDVLQKRRTALRTRRQDLADEIDATERSLITAQEDLALRRELLEEKLEVIGNVSRLEREVLNLEGQLSRLRGQQNQAVRNGEEVVSQIAEARARFAQSVGEQLLQAQADTLAARERLLALDDRLARTVVRAPQSGTVLNLSFSTVGGVVRPGDTIMEIVPLHDDLIVTVHLSPTDRDAVRPGQQVKAAMTAYKSFRAPRLDGEVLGVSADLKQNETTGAYYYEARVKLDASELGPESLIQIIPGMPVDTFIASGNRRTFIDYVFEPILSTVRRGTQMS